MKKIIKYLSVVLCVITLLNYNIIVTANNEEIEQNIDEEAINEVETSTKQDINESIENSSQIIEPGIYEIYTKINDTKVIDIQDVSLKNGGNVQIYERTNAINQKFKLNSNDDRNIYNYCEPF